MSRRFRSIVSGVRPLGPLCMALAVGLVLPACKGKKKSNTPGGADSAAVQAQIEQKKKEAKAQGLIDLANQDLRSGRYVSASKRADEALATNPDNADAHAILGAAKWRAGDYAGSTAAFEKAVELQPKHFGANIGLARNMQTAGQHDKAIELANTLLEAEKGQVDPLLTKLWSHYALAQVDEAVATVDELFKALPAEDPQMPLVQAYAAYVRALEGKGPFYEVSGDAGSSDAQLDMGSGIKHVGAVVGGEFARAIVLELQEETRIDAALAKKLELKEVGKVKALGSDEEQPVVIIPEVKFGDLTIKKVPALVTSLEAFAGGVGETPGLVLGRQALLHVGSITFDFPKASMEITAAAPDAAPGGATELPLLMVSMNVLHAPAVPVTIDGSEHQFYAYFGGTYGTGLSITEKAYLKSGHLPREVDPPDDPNQGLKMVLVENAKLGDLQLSGVGGLVLVNTPPDANLGQLIEATAFELGGYVNLALFKNWRVTYSLPAGKVFIQPAAAG